MNINTTPEYYFKISLKSSLKNAGIYRKIIDKVQDIDTHFIKSESDNSEWRFKCYNRKKFIKIREHYNINDEDYIKSLCNQDLILGKKYEKSGATFWKTNDKKYLIKTVTARECKFLRQILKRYSNYIRTNNTYLVRIYGMYRITLSNTDIRFIIMNNIFEYDIPLNHIYDLKGTTEERFADENGIELKDINFIKRKNSFYFDKTDYSEFLTTMKKDSLFLSKELNIMDYSFLVSIIEFNTSDHIPKEMYNKNNIKFNYDDELIKIQIFGIIDILQEWTTWKKCCSLYKKFYYRCLCCNQRVEIDSEKPNIYHKRFIEFIENNTKSNI